MRAKYQKNENHLLYKYVYWRWIDNKTAKILAWCRGRVSGGLTATRHVVVTSLARRRWAERWGFVDNDRLPLSYHGDIINKSDLRQTSRGDAISFATYINVHADECGTILFVTSKLGTRYRFQSWRSDSSECYLLRFVTRLPFDEFSNDLNA